MTSVQILRNTIKIVSVDTLNRALSNQLIRESTKKIIKRELKKREVK
jgi:hypothetical protein